MRTLTLGYSPCPNDTFIFHALVHGKVRAEGLAFTQRLQDVQTLNALAASGALDITKVSFAAFAELRDNYVMLRSGGALGRGCGPLVIARQALSIKELRGKRIAIPGVNTTAFLLLRLLDPALAEGAVAMPFERIMPAVAAGEVEAGLIIHESRFTYPQFGLVEITDLGRWWEQETGHPIPLGCILARRDLGAALINTVDDLIRQSLEYARQHELESAPYIRMHAQEMDEQVMRQHIALYVNDYSLDIGRDGEAAVRELFRRAELQGLMKPSQQSLFIQ